MAVTATSADMPTPKELEARLYLHLSRHDRNSELLFPNRSGRPFSADKLREKQLHPLWTDSAFHSAAFTA